MTTAAEYDRVVFGLADGRCECQGYCGTSHKFGAHKRCPNKHGHTPPGDSKKVVRLEVVDLGGVPSAMCQACATRYKTRQKAAQKAKQEAAEPQLDPLFDLSTIPGAALSQTPP